MLTLRGIAYISGITMAIVLFGLLLYVAVPFLLISNPWDSVVDGADQKINEDEALELFRSHPAYAAMYERYPDAVEELTTQNDRLFTMTLAAANFETDSYLKVNMHASFPDYRVSLNAHCRVGNHTDNIEHIFVTQFLEVTDCLE